MNDASPTGHEPDPRDPRFYLADVEKRAAQNKTFQIPTAAERHAIPIGHYAKLVFCDVTDERRQDAAERMWVRVTAKVTSAGKLRHYIGELANQPAVIDSLREGDHVLFEARHVCGIAEPPDGDDAA